jgi:hypothetical protein
LIGAVLLVSASMMPLCATPSFAVTVHRFRNKTSLQSTDSLCTLIADAFREYFVARGVAVRRVLAPADTTLIPEEGRAVIYGELTGASDESLMLRAVIRMGIDKMSKLIPYDPAVDVDRNIQPAIDALFEIYESRHFSNVQVFTIPDSAAIWIDGARVGVAPWEARMVQGPHAIRIAKEGFRTLEEEVVVSESDNKLRYALAEIQSAPPAENPPPASGPTSPLPESLSKSPSRSRWFVLGASVAGTALGIFAHSRYLRNKEAYDRPALSARRYDICTEYLVRPRYIAAGAVHPTELVGPATNKSIFRFMSSPSHRSNS